MIARLCCLLLLVTCTLASKEVGDVIDGLFANYDKRIHPNHGTEKPLNIQVEAAILDVYNFDEINHQISITIYFRQKWTDPRLKFDSNAVKGISSVLLYPEQAKKIWIPDTFMENERSVIKHESFSQPNEFTRVYNNGNITRSVKLTVTVGCILNLRWFPFDQNVCAVDFESYALSLNDLKYTWARDGMGKPKIWISKETAQGVRHEVTAVLGRDYNVDIGTGNYSRVGLEIALKRNSFRYLLDVYFPATAIPIIAFITLAVGPLHFRVLMSTICMATMVVYAAILMLLTPKVDYKTALDFYVFNSSVTVFNVVLVNFFIYYLLKPKPTPTQMRMRQLNGSSEDGKGILADDEISEETGHPSASGNPGTPRFPNKKYEVFYKLLEKSYLTMPLFFIAFNLIYWPVVLIASSGIPEDFIPVETRV